MTSREPSRRDDRDPDADRGGLDPDREPGDLDPDREPGDLDPDPDPGDRDLDPDPGDRDLDPDPGDRDLDPDLDEAVRLARALVRLESTADRGEEPAAELVAATMRGFGWAPMVQEVAPGRPNVVAVLEGGGGPGPTLLFEGHTDVVTAGDRADWSVPAYAGIVANGRLHGRGAADMKGGVAAILHAARDLELSGPFPGRLVVAILVDEEGMMAGAKAFARTALAREVDAAIVAEPEGGEVCPVAKGALRLRIELTGAMSHGAMPERGRNPLPVAADLVVRLSAYQRELRTRYADHPSLGPVYVTPTVLAGGSVEQLNVVPARCTIGLDVRTIPGVDHAAIVRDVERIARQASAPARAPTAVIDPAGRGDTAGTAGTADAADPGDPAGARDRPVGPESPVPHGVRVEVAVVDDRPAVDTPPDHPVVEALVAAHAQVRGARAPLGGVPGATDGTILTRDAGIPTVVAGPGGKWIAHQADEYVELADITDYRRIFALAARRYLTGTAGDPRDTGDTGEAGEPRVSM